MVQHINSFPLSQKKSKKKEPKTYKATREKNEMADLKLIILNVNELSILIKGRD